MATVFGWQNYVTTTGTALAAISYVPTLPASNLTDPSGSSSVAWQTIQGVVTSAAGATLYILPATLASQWGAVGLFGTNITSGGTVTFQFYTNFASPILIYTATASVAAGYRQAFAVLPNGIVADYVKISIDDPGNPDGFINVPLAFAGPVWITATGTGWQSTLGRDDSSAVVTSRGGQEFVNLLWQRRRWEVALDGVRASEVWASLDSLRSTARFGGNVLFMPDSASAYAAQEAVYGRLQETADIAFPYQGADRRSWRAKVTERL